MTTLELIQNPPSIEILRGLFIALTSAQNTLIESVQNPNSNMRVGSIPLLDGRFAICADILSEIQPGGMFYYPFSQLTLETINETEIITLEQFKALRPAPPEDPPA